MRQYVYLFFTLVVGGIVLLTAAYPQCAQDRASRYYHVYDANGDLRYAGDNLRAADMQQKL